MITNVSIKFNSIEEHREIKSKLIELGYKADNHVVLNRRHKYVYIGLRRKFLYVTHLGSENTYNSLQEILNDYMKKQRLMNIYENLNENISLSLKEVDALLDIAFGICSRVHESGECFWITSEMRVIYYILTKVKNAKDISEMKEDCEINLYKYFRE